MTLDNVILDIGSIGFGVQSTGMLFAQDQGLLPRTQSPGHKWLNWTREDIINHIFKKMGLKIPPKSSCFFCPFHTIYYWLHIYLNFPEEYELACLLDESIRHYQTPTETLRATEFYLYRGLKPLRELDFDAEIRKLATLVIPLFANGCETGFCMT